MSKAVLLGAGGHAISLCEALSVEQREFLVGVIDPGVKNLFWDGLTVLGGDEKLKDLLSLGFEFFINGIGSAGSNQRRMDAYQRAQEMGLKPWTLIHPRAWVSERATLSEGVQVLAGAMVNCRSKLGINTVVNTSAVIEHEVILDDHAYVSPGAIICGKAHIGKKAFVGAGAIIRQGVKIGESAVVAAGAVVLEDVLPHEMVMGIPARKKLADDRE